MELKNFVSQALVEIVEAVQEAQVKLKDSDAIINPRYMYYTKPASENQVAITIKGTTDMRFGQIVEFDVSVTASERDETQGGVGIQVASITIGAGISGKMEDQSSVVSRLKFSIPIFLPEDGKRLPDKL